MLAGDDTKRNQEYELFAAAARSFSYIKTCGQMRMHYHEEVVFVKKIQIAQKIILFLISPRWLEMGLLILFAEEYGKSLRTPESYPARDWLQTVLREYLQA